VHGLEIFVRSNSVATDGSGRGKPFKYGKFWQYHPRSDRHSKIACWGILFDLIISCPLLRSHIAAGKVGFGINHEMVDFANNRKKTLDLVICTYSGPKKVKGFSSFREMADPFTIVLTEYERNLLNSLPPLLTTNVSSVLVALEAKACMTEFGKARPRLFDELNSSHLTIHGAADNAIAAGLAIINGAERFISPLVNNWPDDGRPIQWNFHNQPKDAKDTIAKVMQLPRRSKIGIDGFDALSIVVIRCQNDGSPITLEADPPAPQPGEIFHYASFIDRLSHLYATRFAAL